MIASPPPARVEVLERLLVGFHGNTVPGTMEGFLGAGLSGIALYPRNFGSPAELRTLTGALRRAAAGPLLIGIDQEGGTRFSLPPPFTAWPSPADLGRLGSASIVEEVARAIAAELRAVGVNADFAPMLDLAMNPESPVTKNRSFGRTPSEVARLGAAFLRGLEADGVLSCAKHFPGHGDTMLDPHLDLPVFDGTRERLQCDELVPFAAAIQAGTPMIMTAHILLRKIEANLPASLSPTVLQGMLRSDLKFDGIILADDLGMGALTLRYSCAESAVMAFAGGADMAMLCHDASVVPSVLESVGGALENGRFDTASWMASRARIAKLREKISAAETSVPPLSVIGCRAHLLLAQEVRNRVDALKTEGATS